jgi:hypothetical protein
MMTAAMAFTIQGTFIAAAQSANGTNSHYHHGYADSHTYDRHAKSHVVTHVHTDGTIHQHVVDDDDGASTTISRNQAVPVAGMRPS